MSLPAHLVLAATLKVRQSLGEGVLHIVVGGGKMGRKASLVGILSMPLVQAGLLVPGGKVRTFEAFFWFELLSE